MARFDRPSAVTDALPRLEPSRGAAHADPGEIKHRTFLSKGTICSAEADNSSRIAWWRGCERVRGSRGGRGGGDSNEFHLVGRRQNDSASGMRGGGVETLWMLFFYFRQDELHFILRGTITVQALSRWYKCERQLCDDGPDDASYCQCCVLIWHTHANIPGVQQSSILLMGVFWRKF